jgi:membrane protein YdbS with pleckstrin-like domain
MEWWEIIGMAIVIVIGAIIRNFIYRDKYRWWNDRWKNKNR